MALEKFNIFSKLSADDLYNSFMGLDRKAQIWIGVAAGILLFLLLLVPVYVASSAITAKQEEYQKVSQKATKAFGFQTALGRMRDTIGALEEELSKKENSSVKIRIEKMAKDNGLGTNIKTLTESGQGSGTVFDPVGVECKMTQVPLDAFMKFVQALESLEVPPLTVAKLSMTADPKNPMVMKDVSLSLKTVKSKPGSGGGKSNTGKAEKGGEE